MRLLLYAILLHFSFNHELPLDMPPMKTYAKRSLPVINSVHAHVIKDTYFPISSKSTR